MLKIKRPLAVTGFTFFITGTIVLSMPREYTAVLLALFALFVFIHYRTRNIYTKHLIVMLVSAVVSVIYINTYTNFYQKYVDSIPKETQTFTAYVKEINNNENTSYTLARLDANGREMYNVSIYYANWMDVGDVVYVTGKFKPAKSDKYIYSNYAQNIIGSISADKISLSDAKINTVKYSALSVKTKLLKSAKELYSNEYLAIVDAIAYNDNHLLNSQLKNMFRTAGLSHTLVVSGLHVGIVVAAVKSLLKYIPVNKKYKNIAAAVFTLAYMYIVGLSASVIRAGFLALIVLLTRNFNKEQDHFTSLALIGFVSIIINPYVTRDIGAMLSYTACIGVITANKWCRRRKIEGNKSKLICAAAAIVFTVPVLTLAQMYMTILSPVYNVCLAVFVTAICVLSVFTPVLNMIPVLCVINPLLVITNKLLISSLLNVLMFIYQYMDFTTVRLHSDVFNTVIFSALAAAFIAYFQFEKNKSKKIFVISVSIIAFVCYNLLNYNVLTITAFDSGREGSFHIQKGGREYLVVTEDITADEARQKLVSVTGSKYETVYFCPKEFKTDINMDTVADRVVEVHKSDTYAEKDFTLISSIDGGKKLFKISAAGCDISFGHGKVTSGESEYYFLGNDKPKEILAGEIYIFGNTPSWMNVDDINNINSDLKIRINLKNGKYKTVKDVLNFGYRL